MHRRTIALTTCLIVLVLFVSSAALAQYQLTNLVSNQVGKAKHTDPLLVNAWGLVHPPGGPFWISDQGSGWSTLYDGNGIAQGLKVEIPTASGGGVGSPTGIVYNGSQEFPVQHWASIFLFATLDGTISGWAPQSDLNNAIIAVDNSKSGAVYTGLAITSKSSGNFLYAADSANNKVDVYDGNFNFVRSFTDTTLPAGFTPFGVQDLSGLLYVAFADSKGGPGGFIDIFEEDGEFLKRLVQGKPLNQPWGIAVAPKNFGPLSNTLLVSNNINNNGTINGFNAVTGQFVGTVRDTNGKAIHIDQLWGITFGGGTPSNGATSQLFFTAGPSNNLAGTFGMITFK
jgi:uncharacterized protein (TIGR03118 family)